MRWRSPLLHAYSAAPCRRSASGSPRTLGQRTGVRDFMTKRMLIDATHAEETRVVVLDGNRLEDFDVETSAKRQLKGNIYLAKVVRVEPSLQAAFVEYGGNRHGFLAFSEIHPDYYQIPHADRAALLEEEFRAHREEEDEDQGRRRSRRNRRGAERRRSQDEERVTGEFSPEEEQAAAPVELSGEAEPLEGEGAGTGEMDRVLEGGSESELVAMPEEMTSPEPEATEFAPSAASAMGEPEMPPEAKAEPELHVEAHKL